MKRHLIIPTYNEAKNIIPLLNRVAALGIADLTILVVDDSSPDGTSRFVLAYFEKHPEVILGERVGIRGRGTAGAVGFDIAMRLGAGAIVEMDSDFSHPPEDLPKLFAALSQADVVVASRLAPGAIDTRPFKRRFITVLANYYARLFLESRAHRSRIRDWTTGFRAYRRAVFEKIPPGSLVSQGPSIVQEVLFRAMNAGFTALEIPFTMIDRAAGQSSFNRGIALQSLLSIPAYRVLFNPRATPVRLADLRTEKVSDSYFLIKG